MKKTLFSAMCALFLCSGMSAKVIYVTTDGNDNNAGTSWETAVKDLNVAISKADKGDDIYIAAGTYVFNTAFMVDLPKGKPLSMYVNGLILKLNLGTLQMKRFLLVRMKTV